MTEVSPPSAYYVWRESIQTIDGQDIRVATKPGASGFSRYDTAEVLLAEAIGEDVGSDVLVLNCRSGLVGVAAAWGHPRRSLVLTSANLIDVEAARRTIAANEVTRAVVYHGPGTVHLPSPAEADAVAVRIPKGRYPLLRLLRDAFVALRPGGRLYLAGANDEGVKSALDRVEEIFGAVATLVYRGGARVGVATKQTDATATSEALADPLLAPGAFRRFQANVRDRDLIVCSRPGVFSWDALDDGSRLLVEAMRVKRGEKVLDLGCGNGVVGTIASILSESGDVHLTDVDIDSLDAARATTIENGQVRAMVYPSDSTAAVVERRFDIVVTNPPFHVTRETEFDVALQFIRDAATVLSPSGRFYLVANRFIPYEATMSLVYPNVETVAENARFKILLGQRKTR